ncbi:MAG: hypothetical protein CMP59_02765 [Flavobacteriales bacterium]|nr:hypothetical protein [Flavobacteriales bacterium]|tara:strand:+ start:281 stop:688 length:408 start_codon:yes stop_codon:yes gene_type:complete
MSFELEGKLIEKFDVQQVSDSFKKREFVVETTEEGGGRVFTEQIKFQLIQDKTALIDDLPVNSDVKVSFNLKGRKWEKDGRVNYFTNLDAWRVEAKSAAGAPSQGSVPPPSQEPAPTSFNANDFDGAEEEDDLPF